MPCYCEGTGEIPVLYIDNDILYSTVALCYCSAAFKSVGISDPNKPNSMTETRVPKYNYRSYENWKKDPRFYDFKIEDGKSYWECWYMAKVRWYKKNNKELELKRALLAVQEEAEKKENERKKEFEAIIKKAKSDRVSMSDLQQAQGHQEH